MCAEPATEASRAAQPCREDAAGHVGFYCVLPHKSTILERFWTIFRGVEGICVISLESPPILGQKNVEKCALFAQFLDISLDFGRSAAKAPIFAQLLSAFALGAPIFNRGASLCSPISNAAFSFPLSLFPFSVFHLSLSFFRFSPAPPLLPFTPQQAPAFPLLENFFPSQRIQPLPLPPTLCRRARRARPC